MQLNGGGNREFLVGVLTGLAVGVVVGACAMPRSTKLPIASDVPVEGEDFGTLASATRRQAISQPYRSAADASPASQPTPSTSPEPAASSDTWSVGQGPVV